jgi:hypothetical protein
MVEEKRKYKRVTTCNVISYLGLDENGRPMEEGMGTTVDVSQGGALIETSRPIDADDILLSTIDQQKNIIEIKGRVVHRRSLGPAKHHTGIEFVGNADAVTRIVKHFILDYHGRKEKVLR